MDMEAVMDLLTNISIKRNIGKATRETINHAISAGLVCKNQYGSFEVSMQGVKLLYGVPDWPSFR